MTEAIAEPGGICLSGKIYDAIQGRTDLTYEDLGAQQFKNIDRLVSDYRSDCPYWPRGVSVTTEG